MKKNVVIIILCILLAGTLGYIAYEKVLTKQPKEIKTEEKKEENEFETVHITSKEVVSLYNSLDVFNHVDAFEGNFYGYLYKQDNLSASEMSNEAIILIGLQNVLKNSMQADLDDRVGNDNNEFVVEGSKVDEQIKKIFGNITYKNTSFEYFSGKHYKYSCQYQNNGYLIKGESVENNNEDGLLLETRIIKAEKNDKELNIYTNVLYVDFDETNRSNTSNIYKDKNKIQLIEKTDDNIWGGRVMDVSEDTMIKYQEQLDTYKLHFEKEDGEYHFKSIMKQ